LTSHAAVAAAAVALVAGCATSAVTLSDHYDREDALRSAGPRSTGTPIAAPAMAADCATTLGQISDKRLDPSMVGMVAGRVIKSPPSMEKWLQSAFGTLQCAAACATSDDGKKPPPLTLEVDLLKAWMSSVNTDIATNLVFKVRFVRANVVLKENTYRGHDTSGNFASAQDEIQQDFDVSMSHVLDQVHRDLTALCAAPAFASPL
jgi:hypothetical protein